MLNSLESVTKKHKVLFIDYDECLTGTLIQQVEEITNDKDVIIDYTYPTGLDDIRYIFFLIDEYRLDSLRWVESMLEKPTMVDSYVVIMTKEKPKQSLFQYLNHEMNGIISLDYFLNHGQRVMETLDEYNVFLEQSLHQDLVNDIHKKKMKDKPINRLVLREEEMELSLNSNEKRVLQHILDGHNNKKISELMYLAPSTVSTVISHLLKKLGANDRTDAMVNVIRRGWVDAVR
ncbi:response regulator transcription factor [Salipaludibacillus neizhouensis]|uniref:response regulator transcription factor n=1 Tax=Salipaludibacillus neizhouensis TaxID=885475 RepID=UPI0011C4439B|nr:LuxR C-terminal-related transcriptional regulator [Salipaludibacillus neizhouensis]